MSIKIGNKAEDRACDFLIAQGHTILERNYRYKKSEVDIITQIDDCIHFIEVKYRKNNYYGYPESFVTDRKLELLLIAAEAYTEKIGWKKEYTFDIISIIGNETPELFTDVQ